MRQIVQCAPNFSEGRRENVVERLTEVIDSCAVQLLDVQADHDLNRCVINFAGEIAAVERAAYAAAQTAAELIDMERHEGDHPRIGAMDVMPFIPIAGSSLGDCVALARRVGERMGRELQIPVYLYGEAASTPERVPLAAVRRREYEELKSEIAHDASLRPDFGPLAVGSAGAAAVGARHPIVAFSVELATDSLEVADAVARATREDSGGLRHASAEGVDIGRPDRVGLAVTIRRPDMTPLHRVMELIRVEAARYGTRVVSCGLIGMVPQSILQSAAQWYLQMDEISSEQVIEGRLFGLLTALDEPSRAPRDFVDAVASESPSPGALAAASLAGALGASLGSAVATQTMNVEKPGSLEAEMRRIRDESAGLQQELLNLIQAEAQAYEAVMAADRMPRSSPEETERRRESMQAALRQAAEVPLDTMRRSVEVLELARRAADLGSARSIGEAGAAAILAHAAVRASALGVEVTVRGLRDLEEGDAYRKAERELTREAAELAGEIEGLVKARLAG